MTSDIEHLEQAAKAVESARDSRQEQVKSFMSTVTALKESTGASLNSLSFIASKFILEWWTGEDVKAKLEEQFGADRQSKGCVSIGESPARVAAEVKGTLPSAEIRCSHGRVDPVAVFRGAVKVIPSPLVQPEFEAVVLPAQRALCYECCEDLYEKEKLLRALEERCLETLSPSVGCKGSGGQKKASTTEMVVVNKSNIPSVPFGGTKAASSRLRISLKVTPTVSGVYDDLRFWRIIIQYLVRGESDVQESVDLAEGLVCPHGKTSDHAESSKYVGRPMECVERLIDASEQLAMALPGVQPKLEMSRWVMRSEPLCPECNKEKLEEAQQAGEEREKCHELLESDGKAELDDIPTDLDGGGGWSYLLPKKWFLNWREYLKRFCRGGKENGKKEEAKSVRKIYRSLLVCDHGNLRFDPRSRGTYDNKMVVVLNEKEGRYIEEKYANGDNPLPKVGAQSYCHQRALEYMCAVSSAELSS